MTHHAVRLTFSLPFYENSILFTIKPFLSDPKKTVIVLPEFFPVTQ
jgi:hypothetical protein